MNNNLIHKLPDKTEYKNTTSHKFKKDLMEFCENKKIDNVLEIGANHGHTTNILSYIANKVYAVDHLLENILDVARGDGLSGNIKDAKLNFYKIVEKNFRILEIKKFFSV